MLRYTTDRARSGLVALYDIRPENGVGQFLQLRSPHGAILAKTNRQFWCTLNTDFNNQRCHCAFAHQSPWNWGLQYYYQYLWFYLYGLSFW